MSVNERIAAFLAGDQFAVVGASEDRDKYGNKVLRCYQQHGMAVVPVNPRGGKIEGLDAYPDLNSVPVKVHGVSVVAPPAHASSVVEQAHQQGILHIWFQPGAESETAIKAAEEMGMQIIAGGPCLLVALGFRDI